MKILIKIQLIIAVILLGVSGYLIISKDLFLNECSIEKAKITEIKVIKPTSSDNQDSHFLMLQLVSNGKNLDWVNYDSIFGDPEFKEGQIIEVYYDRSYPENSEVKEFSAQWSVAIFFFIFFLIELGTAAIMYLMNSKKSKENINKTDNSNAYNVH